MAQQFNLITAEVFVEDLATLLASTSSYTTGDIITLRKEGFSYEVVDADEHLTTAGGALLKVLPGDAGYNVKAFGAQVDGSTNDIVALKACAAACAEVADAADLGLSAYNLPTFYIPSGDGCVITEQVEIERNINIVMDAPILVQAAADAVPVSRGWVRVTGSSAQPGRSGKYVIDVRRLTLSDWASEDDTGFFMDHSVSHNTYIRRADKFTVGAHVLATYSTVTLGEFRDNKIGLDTGHTTKYFGNQVTFTGGEFANINGRNNGQSRYGIRISPNGYGTLMNAFNFAGQSFELNDTAAMDGNPSGEAVPYLVEDVQNSSFINQRAEGCSETFARLTGDCRKLRFERNYGAEVFTAGADMLDDQSTYKFHNLAYYSDSPIWHRSFDSGRIADRATYANASNSYTLRGMNNLLNYGGVGTAAGRGSYIALTGNRPNDDGTVTTSSIVGVMMRTDTVKNFAVTATNPAETLVSVIAYDVNGDQVTTSGAVLRDASTLVIAPNTTVYGGIFTFSGQLDGNKTYALLSVSEDVKEVFVGVSCASMYGFAIDTLGARATTYALDDALWSHGRTERTPLQDDYVTGQIVWYIGAASGAAPGYYVTQGGSLGRTFAGTPTISTTSGSPSATLTDADEVKVGHYIDIAGDGTFRILARQGDWVRLSASAANTAASAAVTFTTPVTKAFGNIA